MTPEERERYNAKARERMRKRRAEMTPAQRKLQRKLDCVYAHRYLDRKKERAAEPQTDEKE